MNTQANGRVCNECITLCHSDGRRSLCVVLKANSGAPITTIEGSGITGPLYFAIKGGSLTVTPEQTGRISFSCEGFADINSFRIGLEPVLLVPKLDIYIVSPRAFLYSNADGSSFVVVMCLDNSLNYRTAIMGHIGKPLLLALSRSYYDRKWVPDSGEFLVNHITRKHSMTHPPGLVNIIHYGSAAVDDFALNGEGIQFKPVPQMVGRFAS